MHGMLSLAVLVATLIALAGAAAWLSVRLFQGSKVTRTRLASDPATGEHGEPSEHPAQR
jgi:hypothetical protein